MSKLNYTVDNLVSEVRQQLDEQNRDSVSTDLDILPALNRAQDFAFDILARKYPEPILKYQTLTLVGGQAEYSIPEDVFEDRIEKLEVNIPSGSAGSTYREIVRRSYRDISLLESTGNSPSPYFYSIIGRKIRLLPTPSGTYNARMWSLRNPEQLVLPQGRITIVNSASNYVIVDSIGDQLTTESDQFGSYVNIIDGQTGEIRGTLQIQIISANKLTFRTTPTRSSVLNRTVSQMSDIEISQDDYIAPILGTCVPYYGTPTTNFLIQFAVSEISRSRGGNADTEERVLEKFEKQLERTWSGRETQLRVKRKNRFWGPNLRRMWRI